MTELIQVREDTLKAHLFKLRFEILMVLSPGSNAGTNALATRSP